MITGYNIREGSEELARRRLYASIDTEVAAAMLRRLSPAQLAALALRTTSEARPSPRRASFHPESLRV